MNLNGFYLAYMSSAGYGLVLLIFKEGTIVGADANGVKFDGNYHELPNNEGFRGSISISVPPNTQLVQGNSSGANGLEYEIVLSMPFNFLEVPFFGVETPFGLVNVRLERLRGLGDAE